MVDTSVFGRYGAMPLLRLPAATAARPKSSATDWPRTLSRLWGYLETDQAWLAAIRDYIAVNVDITPQDLMDAPDFAAQGGLAKAHALFGARLKPLLDELPQVLVA